MTSRSMLNLVLLGAVAVLGTLAYFLPGMEPKRAPKAITEVNAADVTQVRIERADAEHLAFERRDGKWRMTQPVDAPPNSMRVEGVLRIAQAKSRRSYPVGEVDLHKVGLDQPEVVLFFNNGPPIAFGDTEPLTRARYVRVGNLVHLIGDTSYYHVIGSYTTFIDNALLPEGAVVEGLRLPGLKIERVKDRWQVEPRPSRFSADQVNALLGAWRQVQSTDIRRYSGGKIREEIVVTVRDADQPLRFGLVRRTPELILARRELGIEFHLPADVGRRLLTLPPFQENNKTPKTP